MGTFINNCITERGFLGATKAQGGGQIVFTKIVLGDGQLPDGQDIAKLESLVHQTVTVSVTRNKINTSNTVIIGGTFINSDISEGFYWRELGLYAKDKGVNDDQFSEEYLYSYANAGDYAEFIPQSGGQTLIEKNIDIITYVGAATNVKIYIFPEAHVTYADLDDLKKLVMQNKVDIESLRKLVAKAQTTADIAIDMIRAHIIDYESLKSRLQMLYDALYLDVVSNPFSVTFETIDGITLINGVWDKSKAQLSC